MLDIAERKVEARRRVPSEGPVRTPAGTADTADTAAIKPVGLGTAAGVVDSTHDVPARSTVDPQLHCRLEDRRSDTLDRTSRTVVHVVASTAEAAYQSVPEPVELDCYTATRH